MTHFSPLLRRACALAWLLAALTARAAGLPDTGITTCYNDTVADGVAASSASSIAKDGGTHPRQDCRYGRDPAAATGDFAKTGAGAKGLDYTKIANNGTTLTAGVALDVNPTDWACTQDNITGLMWEVKTATGLRSSAHTYTWYSSTASSNAGNAGTVGAGSTCQTTGHCDTEKFVTDVNTATLCSYSDWRMPSLRELLTLALLEGTSPRIDPTYFPNTMASVYWSASSYVPFPADAWYVGFNVGLSFAFVKSSVYTVRLVRGGQF